MPAAAATSCLQLFNANWMWLSTRGAVGEGKKANDLKAVGELQTPPGPLRGFTSPPRPPAVGGPLCSAMEGRIPPREEVSHRGAGQSSTL
jgi:hypothetical protein